MSGSDATLRGIRYETLEDGSEREISPMKHSSFDDDAHWAWDAEQQLNRQDEPEAAPLLIDDRQSGAASPFLEPSQTGAR